MLSLGLIRVLITLLLFCKFVEFTLSFHLILSPKLLLPTSTTLISHLCENKFSSQRFNFPGVTFDNKAKFKSSQLESSRCEEFSEFLLKKKRWGGPILGPIVRYINNCLVGSLFYVFLRVFNRFYIHRKDILMSNIFERPPSVPLLTVSNHQSVCDDPGLFSACIPWWRMAPNKLRWISCTEDIYFANKWLSKVFAAGNSYPLNRSGSLEQPLFQRFSEKLNEGAWCHIFAEGRIWQDWRFNSDGSEPVLGPFKFGVGKLIAHAKVTPIVLPIYHRGMAAIAPETKLKDRRSRKASKLHSMKPGLNKRIDFYVGETLDFTDKIARFKGKHPEEDLSSWKSTAESIQLYAEITNDIREAVLKLEKECRLAGKHNVIIQEEQASTETAPQST